LFDLIELYVRGLCNERSVGLLLGMGQLLYYKAAAESRPSSRK